MFCSNCGKTIRPEDTACPHCGASMGENRFNGAMYTSVQARIPAEEATDAPKGSVSYTRTDYMSYDNQPEPDVYSNTTYRPLLQKDEDERLAEEQQAQQEEQEAQEETAGADGETGEQDAAERAPEDELNAPESVDEPYTAPEDTHQQEAQDVPEEELPHIPLPQVEEGRINPDIEQFMQEFDEKQARNAERRQSGSSRFQMPSFLRRQGAHAPQEGQEGVYGAPQADGQEEYAAPEGGGYEPQEAVETGYDPNGYDPGDYDDGEPYEGEEQGANPVLGFLNGLRGRLGGSVMLKRILAGVVILAVLVCGIVWLSYVTAARSKIAGVTYSAYSAGTDLIKNYTAADYRTKFNETYAVNATYAQSMLDADKTTLAGLLPQEPAENDAAFINTLTDMQGIIATTLLSDAQAAKEGAADARKEASDQEWQIINNSVAKLLSATSISELSTIGTQIAAAQPTATPAPTDPPTTYVTLQKGMKNSTAVQTLQARLIELGYLNDKADGAFGNNTLEAVKAFQKAAGLTVDGVATAEVQTALYALDAPEAPAPTADPAATDSPDDTTEPAGTIAPTDTPAA